MLQGVSIPWLPTHSLCSYCLQVLLAGSNKTDVDLLNKCDTTNTSVTDFVTLIVILLVLPAGPPGWQQ